MLPSIFREAVMMDFVFGWIWVKPGKRDEFMALVPGHVTRAKARPGVYWLEFHENFDDPDAIVFTAGFANAEVHAAQSTSDDPPLIALLEKIGIEGRFENISAETKRLDVLTFDGSALDQHRQHLAAARRG
jgi:quinol monooxygenase YgiN